MLSWRLVGALVPAMALGGCLLLGWDFDKEPPPSVGGGGDGGGGGTVDPSDVVVLGQPDGEDQINLRGGLWGPTAVASCDDKLIVADAFNNRVLIYDGDDLGAPGELPAQPTTVLGQPDMTTNGANHGGVRAQSLRYPYAVACRNGGPLAVADRGNRRVLLWNGIPTENQAAADVVVGQEDFDDFGEDASSSEVGARGFGDPGGVAFDDVGRLAVADAGNHRVMIWSEVPTEDGVVANIVLGQDTFASSGPGADESGLTEPYGLAFDANRLAVSDYGNHRVLIWDVATLSNGASASLVVGQPDFVSGQANAGEEPSLAGLDGPGSVAFAGDALVVSDYNNHRLLVWDDVPTSSPAPAATRVIGHDSVSDTLPNSPELSESSFWRPRGLAVTSDRLYVAEEDNHRVVAFDVANSLAPLGVMAGQPSSDTNGGFPGGGIDLDSLHWPTGVTSDGERLVVTDLYAHRVLIWDSLPTEDEAAADRVVGQERPDRVVALTGRPVAERLYYPNDAHLADGRLLVADTVNSRVLIWSSVPTGDGQPADVVVGQASLTAGEANRGGSPTARTLATPRGLEVAGGKLLVADTNNHRVLIYDEVPTASDAAASRVLGQESLTVKGAGTGPTKLAGPYAVASDGEAIYVADSNNRRVLVWLGFPESDGVAADFVLGQPNFETSSTAAINARTIHRPSALALGDHHLFVADRDLHRVLAFALPITESFPEAAFVLGQPDFNTGQPNFGGRGMTTLFQPTGLAAFDDWLAVSDAGNSRTLLWRLQSVLE